MANVSESTDQHRDFIDIVDGVRRYLEQERSDGVMVVEADRNEVKKLSDALPVINGAMVTGMSSRSPAAAGVTARPQKASSHEGQPMELDKIAKNAAACTKCELHRTRTRVVPGQGASRPEIMFVGEAPGADEDEQGLAFVGRAGQLLTRMIEAMGFNREEVFIANILKCRPPDNARPTPEQMSACLPYLRAQIGVLKPKVIVALGATAVRGLLGNETGITKLRGNWLEFDGIPAMPTLHPAYLLRNPPAKKDVWADMLEVLRRIGREPPPKTDAK
ncbi:MAG: uracil-DNA glycosylase [bacterium]